MEKQMHIEGLIKDYLEVRKQRDAALESCTDPNDRRWIHQCMVLNWKCLALRNALVAAA